MEIYFEIGQKKTFAGVLDWPGWCRSGRTEESALDALVEYAPRYARIMDAASIGFILPAERSGYSIIERLVGTSTTDFGAPDVAPATDARPLDEIDLRRYQAILDACWSAFDLACRAAVGRELRKGPRGGGRDRNQMIQHVLGAQVSYLALLGRTVKPAQMDDLAQEVKQTAQAVQDGLIWAVRNGPPAAGPRGGRRWSPRYFVRRAAWHILDHTWEIENRLS